MIRCFVAAFFYLLVFVCQATADEKIKIGVSLPLSGDAATYGTDIKNALIFSNKTLASDAYGLVFEDDQCSDRHAVTAAQKLVNVDKVKYALGFGCSGALLAAAPIYERGKVVVIASATGAPAISEAGDYIFRTIPSLNIAAQKLQQYTASKHKKLGIVTEETAYCVGLTEAFTKANGRGQLELVTESYLPKTSDFRTILSKMKSKGVEGLFLNPQSEAGLVTIYRQLQSLNWKVPVYAAYYPGSPAFLEVFGKNADGIVYADLPFNSQLLNDRGAAVYQNFENEFGAAKSGEFNITLTYAAFNALHRAIQSKSNVKEYLYKNNFAGIIDGYSFDKNGDVVSDKITFVLKTIDKGAPGPL